MLEECEDRDWKATKRRGRRGEEGLRLVGEQRAGNTGARERRCQRFRMTSPQPLYRQQISRHLRQVVYDAVDALTWTPGSSLHAHAPCLSMAASSILRGVTVPHVDAGGPISIYLNISHICAHYFICSIENWLEGMRTVRISRWLRFEFSSLYVSVSMGPPSTSPVSIR